MSMTKSVQLLLSVMVLAVAGIEIVTPRTDPPLHLPPRQEVRTLNPKIGVHLRRSRRDDEGQLTSQLGAVREMGARFVVYLIPWAYVQPRGPQTFEWRGADLLIIQ